MVKPGPGAARERLAKQYASITEGELQQLADNAWSLTDPAKEALQAELSRRGLTVELRDHPETEERLPDLVTLRRFRDVPEALLAKSVLDSAGIKCFLQDENAIRLNWLWSNALGGMRLLVRQEDASEAAQLLEQKPIESFQTTSGEYQQPRCPICSAVNVSFGQKGKSLSYATIAVGVPLPVRRGGWKCHSCGHEWHEPASPMQNPEQTPG